MTPGRRGAAGTWSDADVVAGGPVEPRRPVLPPNRRLRVAPLAAAAVVLLGIGAFSGAAISGHGESRHSESSTGLPTAAASVAPAAATTASPTATVTATATETVTASAAPVVTEAEAIKRFMETDPTFIAAALGGLNFGGREYCGVDFVGRSAGGDEVYAEAFCVEYYNDGGKLAEGTASGRPILLHVLGAGAQIRVVSWQEPESGSAYGPSIERMFPPAVAQQITAREGSLSELRPLWLDEPAARAAADLAAGTLPSPAR